MVKILERVLGADYVNQALSEMGEESALKETTTSLVRMIGHMTNEVFPFNSRQALEVDNEPLRKEIENQLSNLPDPNEYKELLRFIFGADTLFTSNLGQPGKLTAKGVEEFGRIQRQYEIQINGDSSALHREQGELLLDIRNGQSQEGQNTTIDPRSIQILLPTGDIPLSQRKIMVLLGQNGQIEGTVQYPFQTPNA